MKICPKCQLTYPNERVYCFVDNSDLESLADQRLSTTLAGRYVLLSVLGEGGMATVYGARHTLVDRKCAVKIMSPLFARDAVVRERFRREARSAQKLAHPNIIEIFDQGETDDGTSFIVMEHLAGMTLAELIAKGKIPVPRAVGLMIQMSRGIARAHDLDVIHRDLKPENIFITYREDGSDLVKVLDFGIARSLHDTRLTGQGELFGTPQYMAPERISNLDAGTPADLYALGIIFFEMVTGQLPFESDDIASFFVKHLREVPRSPRSLTPEVPVALEDLILRLLAKDPKARPVDAHRVHQDLVALARTERILIPTDPLLDPDSSSRRVPTTITPPEPERWRRKVELFEKMLSSAYGKTPPAEHARRLDDMRRQVEKLADLRDRSVAAQVQLERIAERGRDVRQRFGFAVDALGTDASKAKDEQRALEETVAALRVRSEESRKAFLVVHHEVSRWEGRSGFAQPYSDLAQAYRDAAEAMDAWLAVGKEVEAAQGGVDASSRAVGDIEFQIRELRAALAKHEKDIEEQEEACTKEINETTRAADAIETQLDEIAKALSDPLRARPELGPLFRELEAARQPAA